MQRYYSRGWRGNVRNFPRGYSYSRGYYSGGLSGWRGIGLLAGGLLTAGVAYLAVRNFNRPTHARSKIFIQRPRNEVWNAWAPLVNLPKFMRYIERVEDLGNGRSRWTAKLPSTNGEIEWIAQEVERIPGQLIRWKTIEGQPLHQAGEIRFDEVRNGQGTVVNLTLDFVPKESATQAVAAVLKPVPKLMVKEELNRFKDYCESGSMRMIEHGHPHQTAK